MNVATRVERLERERFAAACRNFRPWFIGHRRDADGDRRDRATLVAAGAPAAGTWAEIDAWLATHEPTTPGYEAACGAIDLLMEHPDDHAAIRAALARAAPHLGHNARNPPLLILAALRAVLCAPG